MDRGHLDFRNFNRREWKPLQKAAAIDPLRDLHDLRHTYPTFAIREGVPESRCAGRDCFALAGGCRADCCESVRAR